jgi:hypothetical protein
MIGFQRTPFRSNLYHEIILNIKGEGEGEAADRQEIALKQISFT